MNLQKITAFMLKNQPDQTSYLLNQVIDKVNAGDIAKASSGGSATLYSTTGQNTDGAMTQKATTDALNAKANSFDVNVALQNKVDKVAGKGLSKNDFTDALKTKLENLDPSGEKNVQTDWNQTDTSADDYLKNKPGNATTSTDGLMSSADKTKLTNLDSDRMDPIGEDFVPSGGDTPINWISALGNGERVGYYVTNNILTDQPTRYGVLETHIGIGSVAQTFTTLNMGTKWSRSGNQDGWYIPTGKTTAWRRIYDDRDTNYIGTSQLMDGSVTSAKIGSGQVTRSNLSLGYTGNYFNKAMGVQPDGVVEAGKYIDFHESSDSQADFDSRMQALNGNLSFSGDIYVGNAYSQSAGNKLVKESEISDVVHTGDSSSISTSMIADGAVTAGKIDFSTFDSGPIQLFPISGISGSLWLRKIYKIVFLEVDITSDSYPIRYEPIAYIPDGYRPSGEVVFNLRSVQDEDRQVHLAVQNNGDCLLAYNTGTLSGKLQGYISWVIL